MTGGPRAATHRDPAPTVDVHSSIARIDRAGWDALAGDSALESHGWLLTAEETAVDAPQRLYFVVGNSLHPRAAAACHIATAGGAGESPDDVLFGRARALAGAIGFSFLPALVCGPLWHYGEHALVLPEAGDAEQDALLTRLLDGMEHEASRRHCAVVFAGVRDAQAPLLRQLSTRGYVKFAHEPLTYLDIEWRSFDEYRASLTSARARRAVRTELNRNRSRAVTTREIHDTTSHEERLHELADRHYRRCGGRPFPYRRGWFGRLKENLGVSAVVDVACRGGILTGVNVSLVRRGVVHDLMTAIDERVGSGDFTHFVLGYYRQIENAIRAGRERLYAGTGQYYTKSRRGFSTIGLSAYVKAQSPQGRLCARLWTVPFSSWMSKKSPLRRRDMPAS